MTPLQILKIGRATLTPPWAWTTDTCLDADTGAQCSIGVLMDREYGGFRTEALRAMELLVDATGFERPPLSELPFWVAEYNDTHTHEQVLVWWDRAIELAELDELITVDELIDELAAV